MTRKKYTTENIIQLLRQVEILISKGQNAEQAAHMTSECSWISSTCARIVVRKEESELKN